MNLDFLTLIHLSDIHFKKLDFDIDADLRNELQKDAKELTDQTGAIQGILVSGDIAYSGKLEEYGVALNWLEKICQELKCPPSNVWSVPGNHDIDWQKIDNSKMLRTFHEELRSAKANEIDSVLEEYFIDSSARELIYESIHDYVNGFASKFDCTLDIEHTYIEHNLRLNDGSTLKIRGVNSALISDKYDSEKKMVIGSRQSTISTEDGVEHLLICHHPYSWLVDEDERRLHWMARAKIQLFGHKHKQHLERTDDSIVMTAGAMHPDRREPNWIPRYNLLQIRVRKEGESRKLEVNVYPRIWNEAKQTFLAEVSKEGGEYKDYRAYLLPIPNWVGEVAMKETTKSIVEVHGDGATEGTVKKQAPEASLDPARELTYRFLRLPFHKRIEIASKLELLRDEDEILREGELFRQIFRRAKEAGKLASLWDKIKIAYGSSNMTDNPFKIASGDSQ